MLSKKKIYFRKLESEPPEKREWATKAYRQRRNKAARDLFFIAIYQSSIKQGTQCITTKNL